MDEKLIRFFNKINYTDIEEFVDAKLKEVVVNKKLNTWLIRIDATNIINLESMIKLIRLCSNGIDDVKKIYIEMSYENLDPESVLKYFIYYLSELKTTQPSLVSINENDIKIDDDIIIIPVGSKNEESILKKETKKIMKSLADLGISGFEVSFVIDEKIRQEVINEINKVKENVVIPKIVKVEEKQGWTPRKKVEYSRDGIVPISSLNQDENAVELEAYIFDATFDQLTKKDGNILYLVTLKISDNTSSILAKCFANDEEEFIDYSKKLKVGNWYHFNGQVRMDNYAHDYVFQFRTYEQIDSLDVKRKDNENEKRCELHCHTMMSQMDGVIDEIALVNQAIAWGHAGIAITDHDGVQAFPHVFDTVTKYNKGKKKEFDAKIKENEEAIQALKDTGKEEGIAELEKYIEELKEEKKNYKPFKAGYGVELEMCEDFLNVCFNANDDEIENNTFVVFDTETTGFNPGLGDSMIEIGGVKVCNNEIVDRFDELINPHIHIDEAITRVTNISDDDVKDADTEENVIKRFKEWIGTLPLVAHNARFDKNMLDMAYYKYDLGPLNNPIIDTLMLSRVINRDLKKHSLKALGKAYGVDTGEEDDEEESSGIGSNSLKFTDEMAHDIKSIKIDGEEVLKYIEVDEVHQDISTEQIFKTKKKEYYLDTIYKKSKTEKIKIEISVDESVDLVTTATEFELHPAENLINIKYINDFGENEFNLNIYVGQHHGADVDAENTAYIFNRMLKQIEGIKTLKELNNLSYLEQIAFDNNHKYQENIGDLCSYRIYVRALNEEEEAPEDTVYPFERYNNHNYVWKFPWCSDDNLQMYENIPGKTKTENIANIYDNLKHVTMIAVTKPGLKNLFKIVSFANTNFIQRNAKIPRKLIEKYREGILVGSACLNGEIFYLAETRCDEDLIKAMAFYDYIEVQPLENYMHLLKGHDINNIEHLKKCIKKIIKCAISAGKMVVATGDVHNMNEADRLYREIIVNQNVPGKGRHQLARYLACDSQISANLENINNAIKKASTNGVTLTETDIKVLKIIYGLLPFKDISITLSNITEMLVLDKNISSEAVIKTDEDKKELVNASLRKLQIANVVSVNYVDATYGVGSKYNQETIPATGHIPNQFFRTTKEMLDAFSWLEDDKLVHEIVIDNPNKIIDSLEVIEVIDEPEKPYSPIIEHSQETCRDLVFTKAHSMYGDPLPRNIEERIAQEFYGDKITGLVRDKMNEEYPELSDEEKEAKFSGYLHEKIMSGYDGIVELKKEQVLKEEPELSEQEAIDKAKLQLTGIIGGGFDVIYLIAQKLVKHSNDDGYLVGSRGSVGSSFVASMMGITECNGLPAHYYCPNCCHNEFEDENGVAYSENYPSGFDLPNKNCPECNTLMIHQGNDMPFATFLGFAGEKVPDIDLNFSGDNQASAHEYTKVLFGTDNVYRAGTIGTVADKTAFGYVQGFYEESNYNKLKCIMDSLGVKIPSKDDLKKKNIIRSNIRTCEIEREAVGCTGVKRTTGQHPGGIVVVPGYKDVWDFTPFQYPADDPTVPWRTTHFDYHKIEADLLKLDILGHDDPTVLRMLQDLSGIDVTKIDLGDLDTMKIFTGPEVLGVSKEELRGVSKDGKKYCPTGTLGIPEFGTSFLLGMLEETKPTTFAELIKISGLSHGTDVWLGNARDLCTPNEEGIIEVPFKNVIGCRDDIMVNLIQWGLPAGKAFKIMEFVRKGKPSKDPETWKEHAAYMREHNIPEWYIESCRKIKYMFPKAHATAYVTSAFRIAWFKVHHPIWYYCAYLSIRRDQFDIESMVKGKDAIRAKIDEIDEKGNSASNKDIDTRETLCICLEMCCRGFYFKNIDIEKSDGKKFVITEDQKGLIIPFRALDGLGDNVAEAIIKARNVAPFISQEDLMKRGKLSQTAVDKLKQLGCLNDLSESNQLSLF